MDSNTMSEVTLTDALFMKRAVAAARRGIRAGQTPFGACIVKDGKVITAAHNTVWKTTDITAHAEVCAIRRACKRLHTIDLSGCGIYSTCEPCPMCFSAIHWAKIEKIVFGAYIADAASFGFNELAVSNETLVRLGKSAVTVNGGFMREATLMLFNEWAKSENRKPY